jgi:hypothetical protein
MVGDGGAAAAGDVAAGEGGGGAASFCGGSAGTAGVPAGVTAAARAYCERVRASVPGFVGATSCANLSMPTEWNCPTGLIALYDAAQPMSVDFLDTAAFAGTSVYVLEVAPGAFFDDDAVLQCAAGGAVEGHIAHSDPNYAGYIGEHVPSLATMAGGEGGEAGVPSLGCSVLNDAPGRTWGCHLDSADSFVGVFTMCLRPPRRPVEEKLVVVVGNVGPGRLLQEEMYAFAEASAARGAGFEEYTASAQYRYACKVAERNRNRLAAQFAGLLRAKVRRTADVFSSEKQLLEAARVAAARGAARPPRDELRECAFVLEEYQELAGAMEEAAGGNIETAAALLHDELVARRVDVAGVDWLRLAQHLVIDPVGAVAANPYLKREAAAAECEDDGVPRVAAPISVTANSCIEVSGRSAIVYRGAVPQHKIGEGHGVVMTLSRAEGVAVIHGNDCDEKSRSPFGNADPDGTYLHATPTCTGRALLGAEVDWAAHASSAARDAPAFLRWVSRRAAASAALHPAGLLDSPVPHQDALLGDRSVRRERDLAFMQAVKAQSTGKLGAQQLTMLDPLALVVPPQPIRDFPGRAIPAGAAAPAAASAAAASAAAAPAAPAAASASASAAGPAAAAEWQPEPAQQ